MRADRASGDAWSSSQASVSRRWSETLLVARNAEVIEARSARPVGLAESPGAQTSIALVPRDNAPVVEVSFATRDAPADHAGLRVAAVEADPELIRMDTCRRCSRSATRTATGWGKVERD